MSFEPDEMMMQIFRSEVESHSESLTSSLLALEQDPTSSATLDRMMRAAHSIKGAARIVRVNPAVEVAHVMEDCFVAAQKGQLKLTPDDVDVLLRGVDLLVKISLATQDAQSSQNSFEQPVQEIVSSVKGILQARPTEAARGDGLNKSVERSRATQSGSPNPAGAVADRTVVIRCAAVLDRAAAEIARTHLLSSLESEPAIIEIDLAATRDLDAIGLAFLAAAQQFVSARQRTKLRYGPVSTELQTVLEITGLDASASRATAL